jgi:hypothetical protein
MVGIAIDDEPQAHASADGLQVGRQTVHACSVVRNRAMRHAIFAKSLEFGARFSGGSRHASYDEFPKRGDGVA